MVTLPDAFTGSIYWDASPGDLVNCAEEPIDYSGTNASMLAAIRGVATTVNVDGMTLEQALRIVAAAVAGKLVVSGSGGNTVEFLGLDGVTPRIRGTTDSQGNRTAVNYE